MTRYLVVGHLSATTSDYVDAQTPQAAIDAADLPTSICHHCSCIVEIGDLIYCEVIDEATREVVYSEQDGEDGNG